MNRGSVGLRFTAAAALLVAGLGAGGAFPAAAAGTAPCKPTEGFTHCKIFDHSGAAVDFQVPAGVEELDFRGWGMGGDGNAFAGGGNAAYVGGTLDVTPGEHLTVKVGGVRIGGKLYGDALGGKGGADSWGGGGGASTAVRAADGTALFIAAGGGGGGTGSHDLGSGGDGGAPDGGDAGGGDFGGKGAKGGQGGAAGAEGGKPGADHTQGGAGGDGGAKAGGGGAGYAGGGGGGAREAKGDAGSGGGGSSYVDAEHTSDVRLVSSNTSYPAAKDDPFWVHNPLDDNTPDLSGIGQGGSNSRGGDGRVVFQWKDPKGIPVVSGLTRESGDDQTIDPFDVSDPMVVVARNKDGEPLPDQKVTYTLEDPNGLGVRWDDSTPAEVYTDAQGRAESPRVITEEKEGAFTVRATSGDASTTFTAHVAELSHAVEITGGDDQQAAPGEAFAEPLTVKVTKHGTSAADTEVEFSVESNTDEAPTFEGEQSVSVTTDAEGEATATELVAGQEPGTYNVLATAGDAGIRFTVEVTEEGATASPSPSPSGTSDTTTGGTGSTGGTGGTDTQGDSGSLALTGAAGIGTLAGAAAALVGLGWAATRLRKRPRTQD
ncbi:hypothetical protein ACWD11_02720 [Streptomyces sp. NPDC002776]